MLLMLLKMTVNLKSGHISSFSSGFRKINLRSDVELPRQAENGRVEEFFHFLINMTSQTQSCKAMKKNKSAISQEIFVRFV